jgi:hypothetical protein
MADKERTTEEIMQDIAREEKLLSQTAEQIGERLKEKLDWRAYVNDAPYWALGVAAGLGYLASKRLKARRSPLEQFVNSLTEEVRDARHGLNAATARSGLLRVALVTIATKAAADWIKHATLPSETTGGTGRGQKKIKI